MSEQPTSETPPPSGQGVMYYIFDRAGNMMPVTRIERRADGPWEVFSGLAHAAQCLEPLEGAHERCLRHSMAATAAAAIAGMEQRTLKPQGEEA